jgi:hypothetical protein
MLHILWVGLEDYLIICGCFYLWLIPAGISAAANHALEKAGL